MDTDRQPEPVPFVAIEQGDRSASSVEVTVTHDLGDRTLVVVILLACVIGVCGVIIGRNNAYYDMHGQYMRDVATKLQINTNHTDEWHNEFKAWKEKQDADQR